MNTRALAGVEANNAAPRLSAIRTTAAPLPLPQLPFIGIVIRIPRVVVHDNEQVPTNVPIQSHEDYYRGIPFTLRLTGSRTGSYELPELPKQQKAIVIHQAGGS
jgi:hypothetical protein